MVLSPFISIRVVRLFRAESFLRVLVALSANLIVRGAGGTLSQPTEL